ncbi:hypothetical protein D3C74_237980 [compost metagenome]
MNILAKIEAALKCELNPFNPVPEICQVIDVMISNNKTFEESILLGVKEAIEQRLAQLKGVDNNGNE